MINVAFAISVSASMVSTIVVTGEICAPELLLFLLPSFEAYSSSCVATIIPCVFGLISRNFASRLIQDAFVLLRVGLISWLRTPPQMQAELIRISIGYSSLVCEIQHRKDMVSVIEPEVRLFVTQQIMQSLLFFIICRVVVMFHDKHALLGPISI